MVGTLLSLDGGGRSLVLLQLNMPGFVHSPGEALPFLRRGWRWVREVNRRRGGRVNYG